MGDGAHPSTTKGGPGGAALSRVTVADAGIVGARIVPAHYARVIRGQPVNDNPAPPGVRMRRLGTLLLIVVLAALAGLYAFG